MTNAQENSRFGHVFRPGPFHRCRAYWLDGAILHWRIGDAAGHCALADIAGIELSPGGSRCIVTERGGRKHGVSDVYWYRWIPTERHLWGRRVRRSATFANLTEALAHRLQKAR